MCNIETFYEVLKNDTSILVQHYQRDAIHLKLSFMKLAQDFHC